MNSAKVKFKRYLQSKLKDCDANEKYSLLSQMSIAVEELYSELNRKHVFCDNCQKHFLKTTCKENMVDEKEFVCDDDDDGNMFVKGKNVIYTVLYRVCPICGKDDLFDRIIQTKTEE